MRVGKAELHRHGCKGSVGQMRWNLAWESEAEPFPFLTPLWQRVTAVGNIGSQPRLRVTGTISVAGRKHSLDAAPGGQQHTWGSSHSLAWNWGFAGGDWGWLDGATSRARSRLGRELQGTMAGALVRGRRFELNSAPTVLRRRGRISPEEWRADLGRLRISVKARPEDLLGVTYDDPAGGKRVCYHTEVADLVLSLDGQAVMQEAAAAFEYASTEPLPDLPPRL